MDPNRTCSACNFVRRVAVTASGALGYACDICETRPTPIEDGTILLSHTSVKLGPLLQASGMWTRDGLVTRGGVME